MRLCGDATFDECSQGLKRLRLGFAGSHFSYNEWCATQIPLVDCVCHEECSDAVDLALQACAHLLHIRMVSLWLTLLESGFGTVMLAP